MDAIEIPVPKVFISYSWTSPEHKTWVLELANRLVSADRVDVVIDEWDLKTGQDKYVFMERMVQDETISKVLMICDKKYCDKANGRSGGVGDETQIISPAIYNSVDQEKFVPIVVERDEDGKEYLPNYLKSRIYVDLSDTLTHLTRLRCGSKLKAGGVRLSNSRSATRHTTSQPRKVRP